MDNNSPTDNGTAGGENVNDSVAADNGAVNTEPAPSELTSAPNSPGRDPEVIQLETDIDDHYDRVNLALPGPDGSSVDSLAGHMNDLRINTQASLPGADNVNAALGQGHITERDARRAEDRAGLSFQQNFPGESARPKQLGGAQGDSGRVRIRPPPVHPRKPRNKKWNQTDSTFSPNDDQGPPAKGRREIFPEIQAGPPNLPAPLEDRFPPPPSNPSVVEDMMALLVESGEVFQSMFSPMEVYGLIAGHPAAQDRLAQLIEEKSRYKELISRLATCTSTTNCAARRGDHNYLYRQWNDYYCH